VKKILVLLVSLFALSGCSTVPEPVLAESSGHSVTLKLSPDGFVYHDDLNELSKLLFEEARLTEIEFDDITAVDISASFDNIVITTGGDKLMVRYFGWLENQYALHADNGNLTISQGDIPYHRITGTRTSHGLFSGTMISGVGYNRAWYFNYLESRGKEPRVTVEIIIPQSLALDSLQAYVSSGNVSFSNAQLNGNVTAGASSGTISAYDSVFNHYVDLSVSSGTVSIYNSVFNRYADLSASSGAVSAVNSVFNDNTGFNVSSGTVSAQNNGFAGTVSVGASSGRVIIEDCAFNNLSVYTSSGSGHIRLDASADNYDIYFSTVRGGLSYNGESIDRDGLRNSGAASRIELSSSTGSFEITDTN